MRIGCLRSAAETLALDEKEKQPDAAPAARE
jgi:hypothetical protein